MNMSYATIPMIGGSKRLYNEKISPYMVSSQDKSDDHSIYVVDTDLDSSIFFNDLSPCDLEILMSVKEEEEEPAKRKNALEVKEKEEGIWTLYFNGSMTKVGAGTGVYIISPIKEFESLYYQLNFECTNNVAKYEALSLGLHDLK